MYRENAKPDGDQVPAVQPRRPGEVLEILADLSIRTTEAYNGWHAEVSQPKLLGLEREGRSGCLAPTKDDAIAKLVIQMWDLVTARVLNPPEAAGGKDHFAQLLQLYDRDMGDGQS